MNCQGHHHFFWVLPQLFWLQWADEKFIETLPEWLVLSGDFAMADFGAV